MKRSTYIKYGILICLMILFHGILRGQVGQVRPSNEEEESRIGKFYLVPEADFWLGTYTNIEVAPQIAYHLTDRLSLGTGAYYNYFQDLRYYVDPVYGTHMFGARLFSRLAVVTNAEDWLPFYLFSDLFLHLEYQLVNMESKYFKPSLLPEQPRFFTEQVYLGGGLTQDFGQFSSYYLMLLWDLNRNLYTPFGYPVYRIGLNIYFR